MIVLFLYSKICSYFLFVSEKSFERQKPFILVTYKAQCHIRWALCSVALSYRMVLFGFYLYSAVGYDEQLDNRKYLLVECLNLIFCGC